MVSQAYQLYRAEHRVVSPDTAADDLTPYMNYVYADSSSNIDHRQLQTTRRCGTDGSCIRLHGGGMLLARYGSFSGTETTRCIVFYYDPDGKVTDGTTNGPGKSIQFWLYYGGRVANFGTIVPGTYSNGSTYNPCPTCDPPWFRWD